MKDMKSKKSHFHKGMRILTYYYHFLARFLCFGQFSVQPLNLLKTQCSVVLYVSCILSSEAFGRIKILLKENKEINRFKPTCIADI